MNNLKNILIVDDHPFIINGLESLLRGFKNYKVIAKATNGKEAIKVLDKNKIDIVFTDIEMPEMDGFGLIEHINSKYPNMGIVVITMHSQHWMVRKILKLRINAILSKSAGNLDFQQAIQAIENKETYFDKDITSVLNNLDSEQDSKSEITILSFTTREIEILELICEGLTSKAISERMHKSIHTIESHRKNLFIKCEVKNVAGLINYAYGKGFVKPFQS